jgi:tetratricopeptide (TPR) repeat protein
MVMPFGTKPAPDHGDIDFNALWDRAFAPLLRDLGYNPIRADQDLGASIIADMLIRLTASDLVVADLAVANANVYYEIGVRHAARRPGCVLIAPEWAKALFDLEQIRHLPYPLPGGALSDGTVAAIDEALRPHLRDAASSPSPVYQLVPGYPGELPRDASANFQAFVGHLTAFQGQAAAIRAAPAAQQGRLVETLLAAYPLDQPQSPAIVLELVRLARDHLGFARVLEIMDHLPDSLAQSPEMLEQRGLALGKSGRDPEAIAKLEQLITLYGPNPERQGILGGRYKEMSRAASAPGGSDLDARRYLAKAIESYTAGMWLDLNEYYCSSNLPRLLRRRNGTGDNELALEAAEITRRAGQRAQRIDRHDDWLVPTLLGAAFDAADAAEAETIRDQILDAGASPWMVASTLEDLRASIDDQCDALDDDTKRRLGAVVTDLESLAGISRNP